MTGITKSIAILIFSRTWHPDAIQFASRDLNLNGFSVKIKSENFLKIFVDFRQEAIFFIFKVPPSTTVSFHLKEKRMQPITTLSAVKGCPSQTQFHSLLRPWWMGSKGYLFTFLFFNLNGTSYFEDNNGFNVVVWKQSRQ